MITTKQVAESIDMPIQYVYNRLKLIPFEKRPHKEDGRYVWTEEAFASFVKEISRIIKIETQYAPRTECCGEDRFKKCRVCSEHHLRTDSCKCGSPFGGECDQSFWDEIDDAEEEQDDDEFFTLL